MTLKLRILRSLRRLFIILVSLTRSLFSEKMLISNRCISGLLPNLIKKSWTVSNTCCEGGGGGGGDSEDEEETSEDLLDFPEDPEEASEEAEDAEEEADPEPDDSFESYFFTGLGGEGNSSQFTQPSLP